MQAAVNGKSTRATLGKHGVITTEQARQQARTKLADMYNGINPNREKQEKRQQQLTLQAAIDNYVEYKKAKLKARTLEDYQRNLSGYCGDWLKRPLREITIEMVAKRHAKIGAKNGETIANNVMRGFRAIYNYNRSLDQTLPENPVLHLSRTRTWFPSRRRKTYIAPKHIKAWIDSVMKLENTTARDYLLMLIFTGMRRTECATMRWADVDFENMKFILRETKNGSDLELPMSDYLHEMFTRRQHDRIDNNPFVFPDRDNKGYIKEVRRSMWKVIAETDVQFTLHDLRRTFITIAESLDIPHYSLKYLLNHSTDCDVTGGYIVLNYERMREPMQKIRLYCC